MSNQVFHPDWRSVPYWHEARSPVESEPGHPPATCDVAVIGAGYTGLGVALQTARGGRDTLVLDAGDPGAGCSTRNGGLVSTSIKPGLDELASRHGRERAWRILAEGHNALAWLQTFVADEGIDCELRVSGRFHAAHNPARYDKLARALEREPTGLGSGGWVVPPEEQHAEVATEAYHGGIVYPRHAVVQPASLHAGMLTRARESGARVLGSCAVHNLRRDAEHWLLDTAGGRVRARDVVIATNGYTGAFSSWHRRRVIPIGSYVIATEPMGTDFIGSLIPGGRVITDTRRVVYYYRPSPDGQRLIFGGRVSLSETDPERSGRRLHADMAALFPALGRARISHSWVGFVGYTFDTLAHIGSRDRLHYALGYCGSGVAMAPYLGTRLGQKILGHAEGATALDDLPLHGRPYYTGRPWFLAPSLLWFRLLDRFAA